MKKSIGVLAIAAALGIGFAAPSHAETVAQTTEAPGAERPWLGITLGDVPRALSRQLGKLIPDGQGVMIEGVSPNSPAAQAGLRRWDVLLAMDGQKLYSPQQLAALVAKRKPGSEVTFQLVREGRLETVKARIGGSPELSRVRPGWRHHPAEPPRFRPWRLMPHADIPGLPRQQSVNVMEQFEAISIRKLGDDRYRAEIEFLDDNGEKRKFSVEGTYDEVRKQIADNPDLPEQRKNSLLNALKMNPDVLLPDELEGFPLLPPPMPPMPRFDELFDLPDSWF